MSQLVKTVNQLAIASVKTECGLAIASVKTFDGVDNTAGGGYDADAATYFAAIVSAGSTISDTNKTAVDELVLGLKSDSIWTAINTIVLLAGPDDLTGALVPLKGTAPSNVGPIDAGDYNRTTGLAGDGSTEWLDSNRRADADAQNDFHLAIWVSGWESTGNKGYIGSYGGAGTTADTGIITSGASGYFWGKMASTVTFTVADGFVGMNRASATVFSGRVGGTTTDFTRNSAVASSNNMLVMAYNNGGTIFKTTARFKFYSMGSSLTLATLDSRMATYFSAIA